MKQFTITWAYRAAFAVLLLLLPLLVAAQITRDTSYTEWRYIARHAPADTPHRAWETETIYAESLPLRSGSTLYIYDQIRTCKLSGAKESRQMRVEAYRKREEMAAKQ